MWRKYFVRKVGPGFWLFARIRNAWQPRLAAVLASLPSGRLNTVVRPRCSESASHPIYLRRAVLSSRCLLFLFLYLPTSACLFSVCGMSAVVSFTFPGTACSILV